MSYLTDDLRDQLRRAEQAAVPDPEELAQIARAAVVHLDAAHDWIEQCNAQFEYYRTQHMVKRPAQLDKAQTNTWYRDKGRMITRRDGA